MCHCRLFNQMFRPTFHPCSVFVFHRVPLNGGRNALLKRHFFLPPQGQQPRAVNVVPHVVETTILHKFNVLRHINILLALSLFAAVSRACNSTQTTNDTNDTNNTTEHRQNTVRTPSDHGTIHPTTTTISPRRTFHGANQSFRHF